MFRLRYLFYAAGKPTSYHQDCINMNSVCATALHMFRACAEAAAEQRLYEPCRRFQETRLYVESVINGGGGNNRNRKSLWM